MLGYIFLRFSRLIVQRATYCALSVAKLLNILTPELVEGAAEFIGRCQTYEGGMGGYPGNEAHGGYTFCGFAALVLLGRTEVVNLPLLIVRIIKNFIGLILCEGVGNSKANVI
jgi:prenyltransferase beta subunit